MTLPTSFPICRSSALICLIAAFTAGCGSDPAAGDDGPQYDGSWSGGGVDFEVENDRVTRFAITSDFGPCFGTAEDATVDAPIENAHFSFGFSGEGVSTSVSGTFASVTKASGDFGQVNFSLSCGNSFVTGYSSGFSWSAAKD